MDSNWKSVLQIDKAQEEFPLRVVGAYFKVSLLACFLIFVINNDTWFYILKARANKIEGFLEIRDSK